MVKKLRQGEIAMFLLRQNLAQLKVRRLNMIRKLMDLPSLRNMRLYNLFQGSFSSQKKVKKLVQTVGFKSNSIENIRSLSFKPKQPIEYINGRFLIYKSKSSCLRTFRDYFWYLLGISCFAYMLYYRLYFDSNPINKHLYIASIFLTFLGIARKFLRNHNVVKQMYLLEGGKATQVIFQNRLKRKLFGQIMENTYYNSLFFTPIKRQGQMMWKPSNMFPQKIQSLEIQAKSGFYWKKLYMNQENFLLLPKDTQLIHSQILVEVMNGKIILN